MTVERVTKVEDMILKILRFEFNHKFSIPKKIDLSEYTLFLLEQFYKNNEAQKSQKLEQFENNPEPGLAKFLSKIRVKAMNRVKTQKY